MSDDAALRSRDEIRKELDEAQKRVTELQKEDEEYDAKRKDELRGEIEKMVEAEGYTLADLFGSNSSKGRTKGSKPRSRGEAKYRDPESGKTWTGKGRQPAWVRAHVETGGKVEDFAI